MKFRYDINALRAIAVLGVIFFHYKILYFSGGFSGVDVFFVISGYLMSRIIISSLNNETFSLRDFYLKRVKRIVPALLFLILILTLLGFFFYFPKDYQVNEKNAASSILFLSNFLYWKNSNYFDQSSNTNILIHTWSLSVEWQFYLLYPIVLFLLSKIIKKKNQYLLFFSSLTIIIFLCSIAFSQHHSTAAFYLLPSRSWEMMFGGIAFLSEDFFKNFIYKKYIALLGYALILLSLILLNGNGVWPSLITLVPVIATFLVIISSSNDFKILKHKVVQFIGNISYSLYLWHWPVYVFALYLGIEMNAITIISMIVISVVLAYISFKYIESIKFDNGRVKLVFAFATILLAGTITLCYANTNYIMFKPIALKLSTYKPDHEDEIHKQFREDACFITWKTGYKGFDKKSCLNIIPEPKKNVLLIGDSHAAHLSESLREVLEKKNINVMQASVAGCYPISQPEGSLPCQEVMEYMYNDFIKSNSAKIDGVILSANWIEHITCNNDKDWTALNNTIKYFTDKKIKIIIVGQNETYTVPYTYIVAKEYQFNSDLHERFLYKQGYNVNLFLKKNLQPYYIDIYDTTTIPKVSLNGAPYMFDENHFTKYGADLTVQKILDNPLTKNFLNSMAN